MASVSINSDWKALVTSSYIDEVVRKKTSVSYVLGHLDLSEGDGEISFPARPEDYILPKRTKIEIILLGEGTFRQDTDDDGGLVDVLLSFAPSFLLQGIKLPAKSSSFRQFKKGSHFATGVVYDASEQNPIAFYQNVPAPQPEAFKAHRLLYRDTKDLRKMPKGLTLQDEFHIIHGRVSEKSRVIEPPLVSARSLEDIRLTTIFPKEENLKR